MKPQNPEKKTANTVDDEPRSEDSVNFLQSAKLYQSDYSSKEYNTVAFIQNYITKKEPLNMFIKIGNISTALLVDSVSACIILNGSLASQVVKIGPHAFWIHDNVSPHAHSRLNRFALKEKYRLQLQATVGLQV